MYICFSNKFYQTKTNTELYDILANFIETVQFFQYDIQFVTTNRTKKGRHYMLWSASLN